MLNFHAWSIPYESMHHSYLKKDKKIFNSLWNVTTNLFFSPSKTQHSLGISKRKNLPLHIGDAKGVYKNKLAYQTDVASSLRNFLCFPVPLAGWIARCSGTLQSSACMPGRWVDLPQPWERKPKCCWAWWGRGVAAALKWKTANKYRTDADEFQLLWKQLGAVGRASDLEPDLDLSWNPKCTTFSLLWVELFAAALKYRL